ncbi:MAG: enoyl-[acyl-carrier-protein] reductase FabK [Chloroflexota bacterium]
MLKTPICELLGIRYPILLGGMAHLGTAELVAAVSDAGGLGIIGSGASRPEWLREQIARTRERTDKPFGVNLMLLSPWFKDNLDVVLHEKASVVTCGAGNPGPYIAALKDAGIKVLPVIASVALARRLERLGADAVIAEGMESGGHIGETTTMSLVPQTVDAVKIPVIAAGGIGDARGLVAALSLGAQGIQMGTRFICSQECIAHARFKEEILEAGDRSTVITGASTGHPVRCLKNKLTYKFLQMESEGMSSEKIQELGVGRFYGGVVDGDVEDGSLMAGQIAGLVKDVRQVKDIIEQVMSEAEKIIVSSLPSLVVGGVPR